MTFTIAIIGRPNVGKSTLFNRLCKKRVAITHDIAGVTRDVKIHKASLGHLEFDLMDTAGLDLESKGLSTEMTNYALDAAGRADVIIFLVDALAGCIPEDREFAKQIRKLEVPILLVANKAERQKLININEFLSLGFGEPVYISAEHGLGMTELLEALLEYEEEILKVDEEEDDSTIKVAFIGRPNVGKSSLFNAILGFNRSIVYDEAGTTRDAISHNVKAHDHIFELIDTAGMRRKKKVNDNLEVLATVETINALRRCHVAAFVIDPLSPLDKQELNLINLGVKEGRVILLIVNKMDLIKDIKQYKKDLLESISRELFDIQGVNTLFVSAINGKNVKSILKEILEMIKTWQKKISTASLNKFLNDVSESHILPLAKNGRRLRVKYMIQTGAKPPTFTVFANMPSEIPESYTRYIISSLRKQYQLDGVVIRVRYKSTDNPYSHKARK